MGLEYLDITSKAFALMVVPLLENGIVTTDEVVASLEGMIEGFELLKKDLSENKGN